MKKLLIIGFVWPEPTTTAAGGRMMQLIQYFVDDGYKVTFACTAVVSKYSIDLQKFGVSTKTIELNSDSFDAFVSDLNPDVVLFDRFLTEEQFGWRVTEQVPNAIRVLDTEDLHFLRKAREDAHNKNRFVTKTDLLNSDNAKREIASIYRSDFSLIISEYEMNLLQSVYKVDEKLLFHLPFMLHKVEEELTSKWLSFEERSNFVCVGNGKHAPNVDAIKWLKKEIWPSIKKQLPRAELSIYGAYLPNQIKEMHNTREGFLVKGWAEDVNEILLKARINLAPLRFGAGLKGKLVAAMLNGTPSITTSVGTEGMHGNLPWAGIAQDDAKDFVVAAVDLYKDEKQWKKAQTNGIFIINSVYLKHKHINQFNIKLKSLENYIEAHRNDNFIGKMLLHQSMNSTKYLSKYIAEKNK